MADSDHPQGETTPDPERPDADAAPAYDSAFSQEAGRDILAVVLSRVAMFAVLFWTALTFDKESLARGLILIYGLSTILYLATWVSAYRSRQASPVGLLLYFQFLVELLVETAIFYSNEGYHSDYGLLFILTILSAGFFFRFAGAMTTAALATALFGYAGMLHLGLPDFLGIELPRLLVETVQVRFFLYTTLFFMVALLSSLLSGRLLAARKELAGTQRAKELYQFSAESVMNDLPTGLLFFDSNGLLKLKNRPSEEWLGKELASGMGLRETLSGLLEEDILEEMERLREGFPYTELEVETKTHVPLHIQIKTLTRDGRYLGRVFLLIDFTEERKMARTLLRSERMAALGAMSARIAHEIRNPLASISGSAQLLRDASLQTDTDRKLVSLIVTESARLNRILTGMLDYARDRAPANREVSIAEIFKKIQFMLEKDPGFNKELVTVRQFIENGDIRFSSDPDIIVQVLLNVALNAMQALPDGKGVVGLGAYLKTTLEGGRVILKVDDNGRGMGAEESVRAFEPFYTSKSNGTGLGLATCLHYVQALEGNITLNSLEGSGTTVTISLPLNQLGTGLRKNGH
ncbi:MAG: signal transduction histidine kinase, nitrogen specific, NtrB [Fibrobacteres bacterium]|nr:signal transduction histidine kinase, nitrogen specific, NtrB [Fibrobacterota bacterium]